MNDKDKSKEQLIDELEGLRRKLAELESSELIRRKTDLELHDSEQKYRSLVESTDDSIYLVDRNYRYLFMNKKHLSRLGLSESQHEGRSYNEFHSPEETSLFMEKINKIFNTSESFQFEYQSKRDGRYFFQTFSPVIERGGKTVAVTVVSKDVTRLKQMEEELRTLTLTDELTGLYNRRGFETLAVMQLKIANRLEKGLYILYADLDGLKNINDSYGHKAGDRALIETAKIFKKNYRRSDIIARIGGDEFVVIPVGGSEDSVEMIMSRLERSFEAFNSQGVLSYRLSISAGIAFYDPKDTCTVDELLLRADRYMYEHKKGKNKP
jgi:diguanylate cyclase (GGDEF)-like protein/PAS domain S-box-containing protein